MDKVFPRQPWRDRRVLYDHGDYRDHRLLDEPGRGTRMLIWLV